MRPETVIEQLARDLANMDSDRATLQASMIAEVKEKFDLGVGITELARQAGVTRPTIYAWLEAAA